MASTTAAYRMLARLMSQGQLAGLEELPSLVTGYARDVGITETAIFLVDLRGLVLRELTGKGDTAGEGGEEHRVDGTLPGRAFRAVRLVTSPASVDGGRRCWLPLVDGTERLGVLRVRISTSGDGETVARDLATLVGLLLASRRSSSDAYARLIRLRPMSIAAEMQWNLMPPVSSTNHSVVISGAMEPAYEVGGDAFDYGLAGHTAHLAVFDAMGHDTTAGLTANLAVAAWRNLRRENVELAHIGREIERVLIEEFTTGRYATALLAELDTITGLLSWTNHGHHPPIVIRGGRWVSLLSCPPTHPIGTDLGLPVTICREQLEPGDRLLLHTDGVTEARDASGREFGMDRFIDFILRHQADDAPVAETLRRLMHALVDYHQGQLQDDATVLVLEWTRPYRQDQTSAVSAPSRGPAV